jgi:hypothetical protein
MNLDVSGSNIGHNSSSFGSVILWFYSMFPVKFKDAALMSTSLSGYALLNTSQRATNYLDAK